MPDATIAVDVLPAAPSGALRLGLKDAWFLVGWDAASGFDCQQSCQTQTYLVLARFWCNQAESGGAIVKKPRQLIECQRVPTPSLTKRPYLAEDMGLPSSWEFRLAPKACQNQLNANVQRY